MSIEEAVEELFRSIPTLAALRGKARLDAKDEMRRTLKDFIADLDGSEPWGGDIG